MTQLLLPINWNQAVVSEGLAENPSYTVTISWEMKDRARALHATKLAPQCVLRFPMMHMTLSVC